MRSLFRTARIIAPLVVALACAACPGKLDDSSYYTFDSGGGTDEGGGADDGGGGEAGGVCDDVPNNLFVKVCGAAGSGCHTTAEAPGQGIPDLQSPDPASRLVGVCAQGGPGLLIDPDNPSQSVIYTKLIQPPPFGVRMPLGRPALKTDDLACVLSWVSAQKGTKKPCSDAAAPPPADAAKD